MDGRRPSIFFNVSYMKTYGFFRTAAATPVVKVADVRHNTAEICRLIAEANDKGASLVVFPELSLTGATCGDLFRQSHLVKGAEKGVGEIAAFCADMPVTVVAGAPVSHLGRLYDCAIVIKGGVIQGIVPKAYTDGSRWFASGMELEPCEEISYAGQTCRISPSQLFQTGDVIIGVELGEDLWAAVQPSTYHALAGAQIMANPSAGNEILMKDKYRTELLSQHSAKTLTGYIHSSAGFGESSTDMIYAGAASIWENGECLAEGTRFLTESAITYADIDVEKLDNLRKSSDTFRSCFGSPVCHLRTDLGESAETDFCASLYRHIEPLPFAKADDLDYRCSEILALQTAGLVTRLKHISCRTAVVGISGGLDSTLALLVTALAFDKLGWSRERIVGVTMPGYGTTSRTKNNATDLMEGLGVTMREVSIVAACDQHFKDLGHNPENRDVTYENSQARERTQILMDISNQTGGIVIGTGDLSELALGWATYNGDHMSMYGVNGGIPKTLVRSLVKWAAENRFEDVKDILLDIVDTPISPELLPANDKGEIQQVTEDLVGPYELHDFFIYNFVRFGFAPEKILFLARKAFEGTYSDEVIKKWLKTFIRRFFNQQFKRSCLPDGPKVGSVGLSPRGDWNMPSDAVSTLFNEDID